MNESIQNKRSTISMHIDLIRQLKELSEVTGLNPDEIINYCLQRYAKEKRIRVNLKGRSKYQQRCKAYRAYPVKLPQILYEKCFDLRKALKESLSLIFAAAFMAYREDLLKTPELAAASSKNHYSYNEICYDGTCFWKDGRRFFTYVWEKPPE